MDPDQKADILRRLIEKDREIEEKDAEIERLQDISFRICSQHWKPVGDEFTCRRCAEKDAEIKTWKEVDAANTDAIKRLTAEIDRLRDALRLERERNPHRVVCPRCQASLPCESCSQYSDLREEMEAEIERLKGELNKAIDAIQGGWMELTRARLYVCLLERREMVYIAGLEEIQKVDCGSASDDARAMRQLSRDILEQARAQD